MTGTTLTAGVGRGIPWNLSDLTGHLIAGGKYRVTSDVQSADHASE